MRMHMTMGRDVDAPPPPAPAITTEELDPAAEGEEYSFTLSAEGTGITWSIESGSLPDGVTLNADTGAITGTPTEAGSFPLTIRATNAGGFDELETSLDVEAAFDLDAWLAGAATWISPRDADTRAMSGSDIVSLASKGTKGAILSKVASGAAVIGSLGGIDAIDSSAGVVRMDARNSGDSANETLDTLINAGASTWLWVASFTGSSNRVLGADAGGYLTITGNGGSGIPRATYYDTGDKAANAAGALADATPAVIVVQHDGSFLTISVNGVAGTPVACNDLGAVTGAARFLNAFTGQCGDKATWEDADPADLATAVAELMALYGIA
jgi:hypothetical protein